jgi:Ner family transcriptional regulator
MSKLDAQKTPAPQDWHRADIKAALEKRGFSLARLARLNGYRRSSASMALFIPWPKMERLIASTIGTTPQEIWPSRYHEDGSPRGPRRRVKFLKHNTTPAGSNVHRSPTNRHRPPTDAHD